jgi:L-fuculose-phosphate aldolase
MILDLKRSLIETAQAMNDSGINKGTSGNLSARLEDGMLITPSGLRYSDLQPDDIVFINSAGESESNRKPSSEWRFHHDIYRHFADAKAIVHAHPQSCAALACLNRSIPAFHYMVAVAGGRSIRCADYATFGSQQLSENVVTALRNRKACLMANHGLVCFDETLEKALALAIEVENLASTYSQCLEIGEPVILDDEEMDRVLDKFKTYGVQNNS